MASGFVFAGPITRLDRFASNVPVNRVQSLETWALAENPRAADTLSG